MQKFTFWPKFVPVDPHVSSFWLLSMLKEILKLFWSWTDVIDHALHHHLILAAQSLYVFPSPHSWVNLLVSQRSKTTVTGGWIDWQKMESIDTTCKFTGYCMWKLKLLLSLLLLRCMRYCIWKSKYRYRCEDSRNCTSEIQFQTVRSPGECHVFECHQDTVCQN